MKWFIAILLILVIFSSGCALSRYDVIGITCEGRCHNQFEDCKYRLGGEESGFSFLICMPQHEECLKECKK